MILYRGNKRGTLVEVLEASASRVTFCCAIVPTTVKISMPRARFESSFTRFHVTIPRIVTRDSVQ